MFVNILSIKLYHFSFALQIVCQQDFLKDFVFSVILKAGAASDKMVKDFTPTQVWSKFGRLGGQDIGKLKCGI